MALNRRNNGVRKTEKKVAANLLVEPKMREARNRIRTGDPFLTILAFNIKKKSLFAGILSVFGRPALDRWSPNGPQGPAKKEAASEWSRASIWSQCGSFSPKKKEQFSGSGFRLAWTACR
jgi:hypothetical protein